METLIQKKGLNADKTLMKVRKGNAVIHFKRKLREK